MKTSDLVRSVSAGLQSAYKFLFEPVLEADEVPLTVITLRECRFARCCIERIKDTGECDFLPLQVRLINYDDDRAAAAREGQLMRMASAISNLQEEVLITQDTLSQIFGVQRPASGTLMVVETDEGDLSILGDNYPVHLLTKRIVALQVPVQAVIGGSRALGGDEQQIEKLSFLLSYVTDHLNFYRIEKDLHYSASPQNYLLRIREYTTDLLTHATALYLHVQESSC